MIRTVDAAVVEVAKINAAGLGARPSYAEFIWACEEAVHSGKMIERQGTAFERREFWVVM